MMRLASINVSQPTSIPYGDQTILTGIFKVPVSGPVMVRETNVDGDGQADLRVHGGPYQAVYAYPIEHYAYWRQALHRDDFLHGQFGENLTVEGMLEDAVHVGDVFQIGEATLQITQPRVPCFKLAYKMGLPEFPKQFLRSRRCGFYCRVLAEGAITAGDAITRIESDSDPMSVAEILNLRMFDRTDSARITQASALPSLSPGWKRDFAKMTGRATAP